MKLDTTFEFNYLDDLRKRENPMVGFSHLKQMGYSSNDASSIMKGWMATFSHDVSVEERVANHNRILEEEEKNEATN